MINAVKSVILAFLFVAIFASCGVNHNFQKIVVNNSARDVRVVIDCCGDEKTVVVPAFEEKVVFECIYQSFKAPSCEELDGQFSIINSNKQAAQTIGNSDHWETQIDGKNVSCIFTIDGSDDTLTGEGDAM